jgi:hypothetical protein
MRDQVSIATACPDRSDHFSTIVTLIRQLGAMGVNGAIVADCFILGDNRLRVTSGR